MYKFEHIPDINVYSSSPTVTLIFFDDATLSDMCKAFESFLLASGYVFEGEVDIIKEESND